YEGSLYHLKNGKYRIILNGNDRARTEKMAQDVIALMKKEMSIHKLLNGAMKTGNIVLKSKVSIMPLLKIRSRQLKNLNKRELPN
ncbi:MAG: hypothetical protein MJ212_04745, partial [Alphaproteobacteria bacterium]|nr:hypothetical protein [Alphaproteobacteria bacterium]